MPDRTVKVVLTASIQQYVQGMEKAGLATRTLGTEASKLAAQRQAFGDVGRVLFGVGALAAAGLALAIKEFADFDAKMAQVKTLSGATASEMDKLSDSALHLGQSIGFTAGEVADAEIELVKAGVSVKDQLGGALTGALELAAAGQIDVADATEIATVAMTQFGLKGAQVPHVADLLAAGADKALGSVGDLGEALKSGGLVASQFGVSLDETVGTLSAFANAGLIGETAGTDLRQMLLKLANPAADAQKAMKDLGISIYDQSGAFVGINDLSKQLYDKLNLLTPATRNAALATIFGSRAIAGANVLYKEGAKAGAGGIADWTAKVDDSGFAAKQAAGKMDNLNGDVKKLGAAFQTDLIESGSSANDVLREIVQTLTGLVSAVGDIPQPVLALGLGLTSLVALLGLVGGGALSIVPKLAAFKTGLQTLKVSGQSAAIGISAVGGAVSAAAFLFAGWAASQAQAAEDTNAFKESLDQTTGALTDYSKQLIIAGLQKPFDTLSGTSIADEAKKAGVSIKELTRAVEAGGPTLDKVRDKINAYGNSIGGGGQTAITAAQNLDLLGTHLQNGKKDWAEAKTATDDNTTSTKSAASAYSDAASQAADLDSQLNQLIDTINTANGVGQDAVSANAAYQQSLSDVSDYVTKAKKGVDGYNLGVDENTAAGSKNVAMLADLAKNNEDAAKKQLALDNSSSNYIATLTAGHQAVVDNATALGATADQAQAIADKVAAIPTSVQVQFLIDAQQANQTIEDLMKRFNTLNATAAASGARYAGLAAEYANAPHKASGGYVRGGAHVEVLGEEGIEFVTNARATALASNRKALEYMNSGGDIGHWNPATRYSAAPLGQSTYGSGSSVSSSGKQIEQNINIHGIEEPVAFAALVSQVSAAHLRGALR